MWMVIIANPKLPSVTAQDVGRELYHERQNVVQIIGDKRTLESIAWIFQTVPDMFDIQFRHASLIVCRASSQTNQGNIPLVEVDEIAPLLNNYQWPYNWLARNRSSESWKQFQCEVMTL